MSPDDVETGAIGDLQFGDAYEAFPFDALHRVDVRLAPVAGGHRHRDLAPVVAFRAGRAHGPEQVAREGEAGEGVRRSRVVRVVAGWIVVAHGGIVGS